MREDYQTLAEHVVRRALAKGADDAEVVISGGREFTVNVRRGEIEKLIEATSQTLGLRLYRGGRAAASYTSDLSPDALVEFPRLPSFHVMKSVRTHPRRWVRLQRPDSDGNSRTPLYPVMSRLVRCAISIVLGKLSTRPFSYSR